MLKLLRGCKREQKRRRDWAREYNQILFSLFMTVSNLMQNVKHHLKALIFFSLSLSLVYVGFETSFSVMKHAFLSSKWMKEKNGKGRKRDFYHTQSVHCSSSLRSSGNTQLIHRSKAPAKARSRQMADEQK